MDVLRTDEGDQLCSFFTLRGKLQLLSSSPTSASGATPAGPSPSHNRLKRQRVGTTSSLDAALPPDEYTALRAALCVPPDRVLKPKLRRGHRRPMHTLGAARSSPTVWGVYQNDIVLHNPSYDLSERCTGGPDRANAWMYRVTSVHTSGQLTTLTCQWLTEYHSLPPCASSVTYVDSWVVEPELIPAHEVLRVSPQSYHIDNSHTSLACWPDGKIVWRGQSDDVAQESPAPVNRIFGCRSVRARRAQTYVTTVTLPTELDRRLKCCLTLLRDPSLVQEVLTVGPSSPVAYTPLLHALIHLTSCPLRDVNSEQFRVLQNIRCRVRGYFNPPTPLADPPIKVPSEWADLITLLNPAQNTAHSEHVSMSGVQAQATVDSSTQANFDTTLHSCLCSTAPEQLSAARLDAAEAPLLPKRWDNLAVGWHPLLPHVPASDTYVMPGSSEGTWHGDFQLSISYRDVDSGLPLPTIHYQGSVYNSRTRTSPSIAHDARLPLPHHFGSELELLKLGLLTLVANAPRGAHLTIVTSNHTLVQWVHSTILADIPLRHILNLTCFPLTLSITRLVNSFHISLNAVRGDVPRLSRGLVLAPIQSPPFSLTQLPGMISFYLTDVDDNLILGEVKRLLKARVNDRLVHLLRDRHCLAWLYRHSTDLKFVSWLRDPRRSRIDQRIILNLQTGALPFAHNFLRNSSPIASALQWNHRHCVQCKLTMTTNYHPLFCEVNMDLREAFLHTLATALDQLRVGPVSITPPLLSWLDPLRVTETMDTLQAAAQDASCGDAGFHHTKDQFWWLLFPPENFSGTLLGLGITAGGLKEAWEVIVLHTIRWATATLRRNRGVLEEMLHSSPTLPIHTTPAQPDGNQGTRDAFQILMSSPGTPNSSRRRDRRLPQRFSPDTV